MGRTLVYDRRILIITPSSESLHNALTDPIEGLYTSNASTPLETEAGLRLFYEFGLYSHCGYISDTQGICTNHTAGRQFKPYDAITSDMAANYTRITEAVVVGTTFQNSHYLGQSSKAAYWMLLLGTLCAFLALLTSVFPIKTSSGLLKTKHCGYSGILKNSLTFFVSTLFSIGGSLLILVGASIWTVLIKRTDTVNNVLIGLPPIPVGIVVSAGSGLFLAWAAFACMVVSIVPYMIRYVLFADQRCQAKNKHSCCTYRG